MAKTKEKIEDGCTLDTNGVPAGDSGGEVPETPVQGLEHGSEKIDPISGAVAFQEIARRQAERKGIAKHMSELPPPAVFSPESIAEQAKKCKELHKEYSEACYLVDYDIDRMKKAIELSALNLRELVECESGEPWSNEERKKFEAEKTNLWMAQADKEVPLSARDREQIEIQRKREEDAKEAEERKQKKGEGAENEKGDLPGQTKLKVKDDGFVAEAASECVTYPLEEDEEMPLDD